MFPMVWGHFYGIHCLPCSLLFSLYSITVRNLFCIKSSRFKTSCFIQTLMQDAATLSHSLCLCYPTLVSSQLLTWEFQAGYSKSCPDKQVTQLLYRICECCYLTSTLLVSLFIKFLPSFLYKPLSLCDCELPKDTVSTFPCVPHRNSHTLMFN